MNQTGGKATWLRTSPLSLLNLSEKCTLALRFCAYVGQGEEEADFFWWLVVYVSAFRTKAQINGDLHRQATLPAAGAQRNPNIHGIGGKGIWFLGQMLMSLECPWLLLKIKGVTICLTVFWFFFNLKKINFYFFLALVGLHCCVQAFSSGGEQGLLPSWGTRTSHCGGVSCGSWVLELRLSSCGTWA